MKDKVLCRVSGRGGVQVVYVLGEMWIDNLMLLDVIRVNKRERG